jgi:hypothetical protein
MLRQYFSFYLCNVKRSILSKEPLFRRPVLRWRRIIFLHELFGRNGVADITNVVSDSGGEQRSGRSKKREQVAETQSHPGDYNFRHQYCLGRKRKLELKL